ncbi:hypothetical protein GJV85_02235 [Sulfurimonas aquatica]|uniref:Uncharacterized protein n=1 Tax=Sulfurimonas aquatica TaxID=2672570 RepID=A0A975AYK7_9BACT|nr:hypothetical protein [Sulfurimonas aquatica]QSZ40981.1 hypothetical protein GJV85_02235 [Sulfurimonas aquatica]
MKNSIYYLVFLAFTTLLIGCGESEDETVLTTTQGWHYQGRDCLGCHNIDLKEEKHLLFGGTLYKSENVTDQNDLDSVCGGNFIINFLDSSFQTIYSSKDYVDENSPGYNAKGNLFVLQRELPLISAGEYRIQITDENGIVMAIEEHTFNSQPYDINNPANSQNNVSCNACHGIGKKEDPIYVEINANLCK